MGNQNSHLENTVFWVGSGISKNNPSSLPLGVEFSEFYIKKCLGSEAEGFLNRYRKIFKLVREYNKDSSVSLSDFNIIMPRLEIVFNIFKELKEESEINLLDSLNFLGETIPNKIHYLLAYLFRDGCSIITPNYDLLIEKAFEENSGAILKKSCPNQHSIIYKNEKAKNSNEIFHYHGVYTDVNSLGISLNDLTSIDKHTLVESINCYLESNSTFIMLGFSFSDDLDVLPIFTGDLLKKNKSHLVFVQHRAIDSEKKELEEYKKKALENVFEDRITTVHSDAITYFKESFEIDNLDFCDLEEYGFIWTDLANERIPDFALHEIELIKLLFSYELGIVIDFDSKLIQQKYPENRNILKKINNLSSDFGDRFHKSVSLKEINDEIDKLIKASERNDEFFRKLNRVSWSLYHQFVDSIKTEISSQPLILTSAKETIKLLDCITDSVITDYKVEIVAKRNKSMLNEFVYETNTYKVEYMNILTRYMLTNNVDGVISVILDVLILDRYYSKKYNKKFDDELLTLVEELVTQAKNQKHIAILEFVKQI